MLGDVITPAPAPTPTTAVVGGVVTRNNYFGAGCHPRLPPEKDSAVVVSVAQRCIEALAYLSLGTPLLESSTMSVAKIVNLVTKNQGKIVEGNQDVMLSAVLADTLKMLGKQQVADFIPMAVGAAE